jgi:dipeptidyl aminopeptidase/acylaminoacyl peptidase
MLNFSADAHRTPRPQSLSLGQKLKVMVCGVTVPRPVNTRSPKDLELDSEIVQFSADDGFRLEGWLLLPSNPRGTVLLFHGYAASRSDLLPQSKEFYDMGWAVVLVDFRGSGGSEGCTTSVGFDEAKDVAATVRYVRERGLPRPLILYGQSMGGAAVLRSIAALDVCVDGIVLESVFDRMLKTVRNRFGLMGLPSFPSAELLVFWGGVQTGFSGFEHNPVEYARSCSCAALVLHGTEDRNAKPEEGRAVFESLKGKKEMVEFSGAGHESLYTADQLKWKRVVGQFLAKQAAMRTQTGP